MFNRKIRFMRLKFNKWLFSLVALIFGFSGSVAAQYGVPENHYMVKGNVISEKCQDAIPKIQITLRATDADGVDHDMPAITDENGNFSIDNWNVKTYSEYLLIAEDLDGTENKGDFEPSRQQIILGINDFENSKNENWNRYFESKKTYHFALKMRKDEPCK